MLVPFLLLVIAIALTATFIMTFVIVIVVIRTVLIVMIRIAIILHVYDGSQHHCQYCDLAQVLAMSGFGPSGMAHTQAQESDVALSSLGRLQVAYSRLQKVGTWM